MLAMGLLMMTLVVGGRGNQVIAGNLSVTPQSTPTEVRRTATPTSSPTAGVTEEPVETPEPVATTAPPTTVPTAPGGAAGGGVQAPSTGTGDASSGTVFDAWLIVAGAALVAAGGGALFAGVRRRS